MPRVKCPKCGFVNPEGQARCARCDAHLPRVRTSDKPNAQPWVDPQTGKTLFRPGQTVAGRYTIVNIIGQGGMGCIYRARDNTLGGEVALKTLLPQFVRNKLVVERFFNEARIARHLSHPNIIRVHDIGMSDNVVYISMELVKGKSLRNILDELPQGRHLPVDRVLEIVDELCAALEYAHQYTIHRDIKPENVMILPDGSVKLMDFGISKLMTQTRLTAASVVMGTPMYMSPEQFKDSREVDARSDIFSVGVLLYEALTGNVPTGVPKPPSHVRKGLPPELDGVLARCVEPQPEQRFQSATELRDALRTIRLGLTPEIAETAIAPVPDTGRRRSIVRPLSGVVLMFLIAGLAAWSMWRLEQERHTAIAHTNQTATEPGAVESETRAELDRIATLIEQALPQAELEAADGDDAKVRTLELAKAKWKQVQKRLSDNPGENTLRTAEDALECAMALLVWPEGMVFIPPGVVRVGQENETRPVRLAGFFIDETEVTAGQYKQFVSEANWRSPPYLGTTPDNFPVTMVTFYDAQAYAVHNDKRLPTEAQWAMAAYGHKTAPVAYPWGDEWGKNKCNVSTPGKKDAPAPVKSYESDLTEYGCWDMAGNVMEWTRSKFLPLPYDPGDGRENPVDLYFGTEIALRGACYAMKQAPLTSRYKTLYEKAFATLGFRCVREMPQDTDALEKLL